MKIISPFEMEMLQLFCFGCMIQFLLFHQDCYTAKMMVSISHTDNYNIHALTIEYVITHIA